LRITRLFPALLAIGALLAGDVLGAQSQELSMPGFPKPGAPPVVTLLAPGAAPRKAIRYAVTANQKSAMDMTTTVSMAMNLGGMAMPMDMPTTKLSIDLGVTNITPGGDITYNIAFTGMTIDEVGGGNPALTAAFQQAAATITSTKGTATVSNRGLPKSSTLDVSDPAIKQMLTAMVASIENLAVPFPEEAIGIGGRWEVRQVMTNGGQTSFQKTEYEVVSIEGLTVSLKMKSEQTGPPQTIPNPILPGTDINLESLTGTSTGTVVIRLDSLVPTSEVQAKSSTVMSMSLGGQAQSIATEMTSKLTVAPSKGK